jgi:hypothetical protein
MFICKHIFLSKIWNYSCAFRFFLIDLHVSV